MVAIGSAWSPQAAAIGWRRQRAWIVGALLVLIVGTAVRSALGGGGVGERSGVVLATVLWLSMWVGALLLTSPRTAFGISLAAMVLLDLAAAPARLREYDERTALYRTDQALTISVTPVAGSTTTTLALLAEPVYAGDQPRWRLAAELGATSVEWTCPYRRGMQWLSLPLPPGARADSVRLRLTGAPARDGDYLLVYASAARGGNLAQMRTTDEADATRCSLQ